MFINTCQVPGIWGVCSFTDSFRKGNAPIGITANYNRGVASSLGAGGRGGALSAEGRSRGRSASTAVSALTGSGCGLATRPTCTWIREHSHAGTRSEAGQLAKQRQFLFRLPVSAWGAGQHAALGEPGQGEPGRGLQLQAAGRRQAAATGLQPARFTLGPGPKLQP